MTDKKREDFEAEDFDLQPFPKQRSYAPTRERDTTASEINDGVSAEKQVASGFRIPPAGRDPAASRQIRTARYSGASFEKRNNTPRPKSEVEKDAVVREYSPKGPFIRHVTVRSWPTGYNFYEKFVRDAMISHGKTGSAAPHVPYFSYIPQYGQLTSAQWAYYLYMKASVKAGVCLRDADFSYVLLYIYEIINLEGAISPTVGADLLGRVWAMYRQIHPMLDKYMSEWMADYCLIYSVPLPKFLRPILPALAARSGIREFFADEAVADETFSPGPMVRMSMSDYTPERSRYARTVENFSAKVEEVFDAASEEQMRDKTGFFDARLRRRVTVTRDAFCGSLCSSSIKKKLILELDTPFRSPDSRRIVTEMMKGAENIVRGRLGIKARLAAPTLMGRAALVSAKTDEEREYLSFYESPSEPLTMDRAAEIEEASWRNTEILTEDVSDYAPDFEEPAGAVSFDDVPDTELVTDTTHDDMRETLGDLAESTDVPTDESFLDALRRTDEKLYTSLMAAVRGGSFAASCREAGLFADDAASRINDIAMDIIGDVVLESTGVDYAFVEDYREDIK